MRYILVGSGKIALSYLKSTCLLSHFDRYLYGIVGDSHLINYAKKNFFNISTDKLFLLGEKKETEHWILNACNQLNLDYILSIQYPWILSTEFIHSFSKPILNLHNAKIPDYRGHNCISHEILEGETSHTSTLHLVTEAVDRGYEIASRKIDIETDDTAYSLWERSLQSCIRLLETFHQRSNIRIDRNKLIPVKGKGKFYSKFNLDQFKVIANDASINEIDTKARAFWFPPYEPAHFIIKKRKFYVFPNHGYKV